MFQNLRDEVQQQIQRHMAALNHASTTQELQALTAESLQRMEQSSAAMSGQLLRLGTSGSGSGSGVIANYGGLEQGSSPYPMMQSHPPPHAPSSMYSMPIPAAMPQPQRSNTLLIVITIGFFVLAALLIVVYGTKKTPKELATDDPKPANSTASTTAPTQSTTGEATTATTSSSPATTTSTASPPPTGTPSTTATATSTHHTVPTRTPTLPLHPPPPPVQEDPGFVTVSSYPWAKVSEGGKVVCPVTPCNKVQMAPGAHTLVFENGVDPTQKQSLAVSVKSGETSTKSVGFK